MPVVPTQLHAELAQASQVVTNLGCLPESGCEPDAHGQDDLRPGH